ncbi:MAG TPA: acetyl-CoA carboxylase biotin carboxyl carrier protein [Thermoanaerobaculia bacterium]|nr:acetyl-CoA carboxylase biotin carboxyl carrier protein [Thermoanaerobaculia bacterium]
MLTFEQIKELIELVAERQLQGVEIERSGFRLKIDGYSATPVAPSAGAQAPGTLASPLAPTAPMATTAPPTTADAANTTPAPAASPGAGSHILTSPIVGTFYRASSPDADPFAEVGARVKKGQVVCIIEAMKLMNEIESDVDGVVVEIYPQNAQAVEFGEPLFAIRTS